jgi:predicted CxxxxCH...CXXCH cytochrome family protein
MSCHGNADWYTTEQLGCAICHSPGTTYDPLTLNGSGSDGKHTAHIANQNIPCDKCHLNYGSTATHRNGELDTDLSANLIFFQSEPGSLWDDSSNTCSNLSCHGDIDWYTTAQMGCALCHAPGTTYDPLELNGIGSDGKHTAHVANRNIPCDKCHLNYGSAATHRNGVLNTDDAAADLISFEGEPGATWDISSSTCGNMSCHGDVDWYTTVEQGCTFCHAPGTTYDPLAKGKHTKHVSGKNYSCETCHYNYTSLATHNDGTLDGGPVTSIVSFDPAAYPGASWVYSTCNNLWCHGGGIPDWLGAALTCRDCHVSGDTTFDPEEINGSGSDGKHVTHVNQKGYLCESCHFSYRNASTHNNGQWDKGSDVPAVTLVSFDPATYPGASWSCLLSTCNNLWCHGAGTPDWYDTTPLTCRSCHVSGDGTFDPTQRDGALPGSGKHSSHLNTGHEDFSGNMHCEICHYTYRDAMTHNNGDWNNGDPSGTPVTLISFDPGYAGSWVYSTCQSMNCHGNADWFTTDPMLCTNCHDNAYSVYHPVPNVQGEHSFHITNRGYACDTCHNGYTSLIDTHHLNGVLDTPPYGTGSVNIIFFLDQASYMLNWEDNNIGNCSRTGTGPGCHGGWDLHPWYDPSLP